MKIPCSKCGVLIMPTTAARNSGACEPCNSATRELIDEAKRRDLPDVEPRPLEFRASRVSALTVEYTEDYIVHGVYFEVGDPEVDGHHWNFSRSFKDDDGVCTVREPQRAVVYNGIRRIVVSRGKVVCEFDVRGQKATGFSVLVVLFDLNDAQWREVADMFDRVFLGETCYTRADT